MKLIDIFLFLLLLSFTTLNAETLPHTDDFENSSANGWTYDAGDSNELEIRQNNNTFKSYSFGPENANKKINVTFELDTLGGWEDNGASQDYFYTKFNDDDATLQTISIEDTEDHVVTYNTQLTSSGTLKIDFRILVSDAPNEYAQVAYVTIREGFVETLRPEGEREFTLYKQNSIRGNIQLIGNSVKLDANGVQFAGNGTNNNSITTVYADRDNDTTTFNSTSATLKLPPDVKSDDILYAMLYWQGRTNADVNFGETERNIKIKTSNQTSYTPLRSIDSKFNWLNEDYQGITDITDIIKTDIDDSNQTLIEINGYNQNIWIADVHSPDNSNGFGAWAIAVVYEDGSTLRNISTYDGYKSVHNETITTDLTGFLTPTTGVVDSDFLVFAGEGDITLTDNVTLTDVNDNEIALGNNIFKSSVDIDGTNVTSRNPFCQNTIGVDIRRFNVGTNANIPIIGNSQTSTTIKLVSTGDEYIPGFFAFATQLYEPRVCYFVDTIVNDSNVTIFENKAFVQDVEADELYTYNIWISNMKKEVTDVDLETAELVQVYTNMTNFDYEEESTNIKNIGATNFSSISDSDNSDIGEFASDSNSSTWRIGTGSTGTQGGTLVPALNFDDDSKKVFINFQGKLIIEDPDLTSINLLDHLEFKASFQTDTITIGENNAQELVQCTDIDSSGSVSPLLGAFNAIDAGNGTANMTIGTKVVNQPFNVDIISLDTFGTSLSNHSGDVIVNLIEGIDYSGAGCADTDTACKQALCDAVTSLKSLGTLNFNGTNRESLTVVYDKAIKKAGFQIIYNSGSNSACSTDLFAIRPKKFDLAFSPSSLQARAEPKNIRFVAEDEAGNPTIDYNEAFAGLNVTSDLANPTQVANCTNDNLNLVLPTVNFTNGAVTASNIPITRVGVFNIVLKETVGLEFASVDLADTSEIDRLIEESNVNFTIVPEHFFTTPITNVNNESNFTYLSNDLDNMAITFDTNVTARNSLNGVTPNYDEDCFANPINVDINYTVVSGTMPALIRYKELNANIEGNNTATNNTLNLPRNPGDTLPATLFTNANNGTAELQLRVNFPRDLNTTLNPFRINFNDIGVSDQTIPALTVSNELSRTIDNNATLVYGRTNVPRAIFQANPAQQAFIFYEVFCNGVDASGTNCDRTLLPNGINSNYTNDPRWSVNTFHTNISGTAGSIYQQSFTPGNGIVTQDTLGPHQNSVFITYDASRGNPYKVTMENNASSWLIYNRFDPILTDIDNEFEVEFLGPRSSWGGKRETNTTTGQRGTEEVNRRSMW